MLKERSVLHKVNQETYALVFKELLDGPASCQDLVDVSGLHLVTVQSLMRVLNRHKVVHIAGWNPDSRGRDTSAVFAFGKGRDVKRRVKPKAEIAADYRARKQMKLLTVAPIKPKGETHHDGPHC